MAAPAAAQDKKEEPREEIEDVRDPNQPKATSLGTYGIETYPLSEHDRTLLLPAGVFEVNFALHIDISEAIAFKIFTPELAVRYGVSDSFELQAGTAASFATEDLLPDPKVAFVAAEFSLAYDLIDARLGLIIPYDPDTYFDIFVGLPLKFRVTPKISILGLEQILIIHTADQDKDDDTDTPDLLISAAASFQAMERLAIQLRASLFVSEFKFSKKRQLPVDLDIQYTVSPRLDVGGGVSLTNVAPPKDQGSATDSRAIRVFARFRF